jgi:ATP-dependent HslUV protease, peptidase subunit HslV
MGHEENIGMVVKATTILSVRGKNCIAMGGDGQVTLGNTVAKNTANKIRKLLKGAVLAGFAGSSADALTLFENFSGQLEAFNGSVLRAAVEFAKAWRNDKSSRRLDALMMVADRQHSLLITGSGDVLEPEHGVLAIGSGGNFALSAAMALSKHTMLPAKEIVTEALKIAADICIYTNQCITVETLYYDD